MAQQAEKMRLIVAIGRGQSIREHATTGISGNAGDLHQFRRSDQCLLEQGMTKRLVDDVACGLGKRRSEQSLDQSLNSTTTRAIQFPQIRIGINQLPGRVCPAEIETEPFFKQRQREREPID